MSNLDKANSVAHEWVESMGGLEAIRHNHGSDLSGIIQALDDAGLLAPDAQVIRTVKELEALDPKMILMNKWGDLFGPDNIYSGIGLEEDHDYYFPCVKLTAGSQVRAARKAMEEENG